MNATPEIILAALKAALPIVQRAAAASPTTPTRQLRKHEAVCAAALVEAAISVVEKPRRFSLRVGPSETLRRAVYLVDDLAQASKIYSDLRDRSGEGCSTFPSATITTPDCEELRISYNGKIWRGDVLVFDPYANEAAEAEATAAEGEARERSLEC